MACASLLLIKTRVSHGGDKWICVKERSERSNRRNHLSGSGNPRSTYPGAGIKRRSLAERAAWPGAVRREITWVTQEQAFRLISGISFDRSNQPMPFVSYIADGNNSVRLDLPLDRKLIVF